MPNLRLVNGNKAEFGRPPPRLTIPGCSRRGISFRIADGCRRFDRGDRYLAKSLIRVWSFCSASAAADEEPAALQAVDEKECELEKDMFFREDRKVDLGVTPAPRRIAWPNDSVRCRSAWPG